MGETPLTAGRRVVGETVRFGYYDQRGLEISGRERQRVLDYVVSQVKLGVDEKAGDGGAAASLLAEFGSNAVGLSGGGGAAAGASTVTVDVARQLLTKFAFPASRWQDEVQKLSGGLTLTLAPAPAQALTLAPALALALTLALTRQARRAAARARLLPCPHVAGSLTLTLPLPLTPALALALTLILTLTRPVQGCIHLARGYHLCLPVAPHAQHGLGVGVGLRLRVGLECPGAHG